MRRNRLDDSAKKSLLTLMQCGVTSEVISSITGVFPATIYKYRKRFRDSHQLTTEPPQQGDLLERLFELYEGNYSLELLKYPTSERETDNNHRQVFVAAISKEIAMWVPLFYPRTAEEKLWWDLVDLDLLVTLARGVLDEMFNQNTPPNAASVRSMIFSRIRSGEALPCWAFRREVIKIALNVLTRQQKAVIVRLYGLNERTSCTIGEVAKKLKLSIQNVLNTRFDSIIKLRRNVCGQMMPITTWSELFNNLLELKRLAHDHHSAQAYYYARSSVSEPLKIRIDDLDFSVRTYHCLKKSDIETIGDLLLKSEDDLMKIRNFGKKCLEEVVRKLEPLGFSLSPKLDREPEPDYDYDLDQMRFFKRSFT